MSFYRLMIVLGVWLLVVASEGMPFGRTTRDEDHPPPDDSDEYEDRMVALASHALGNSTMSGTGHVEHEHDTWLWARFKIFAWVVLIITGVLFIIVAIVGLFAAFYAWKRKCSCCSKKPNPSYGIGEAATTEPLVPEMVVMSNVSAGGGSGSGVVLGGPGGNGIPSVGQPSAQL